MSAARAPARISVRATTLVAVLFWTFVLAVFALDRYDGDARALLCLGTFPHPPALAAVPRAGPAGYDGQYYASLATDPWLLDRATPRYLDNPHYRATRIGLPLLAWLVALGNPAAAAYTYLLLGWGLGLLAIYLTAVWLAEDGRSPGWALLLLPSAGFAAAMTRCTPDAAALGLVMAALWLHRRRRAAGAAAVLAAATLVRETSLLVAAAIAFAELRERRYRAAATAFAAPLLAYAAWQGYLGLRLVGASSRGVGLLTLPFSWVPRKVAALLSGQVGDPALETLGFAALLVAFAALAAVLSRFPRWTAAHALYAMFAALAAVLSFKVLVEAYAYARVLIALPFLALLLASGETVRWRRVLFTAVTAAFALAGWPIVAHFFERPTIANALAHLSTPPAQAPAAISAPEPPRAQPAAGAAFYLLPVANASGFDGAQWRTEVELHNLGAAEVGVTVELLETGLPGGRPAATLPLPAQGSAHFDNALRELFGATGVGALRLVATADSVAGWCRTYDASRTRRPAALAGVRDRDAFGTAADARLTALTRRRGSPRGVWTNLGVLSLSAAPSEVAITLADGSGSARKMLRVPLDPLVLRQLNDVFAGAGPAALEAGSATVHMVTPGGRFLAYAAVVGEDTTAVRYVLPAPAPPAAAAPAGGAAAAPRATPPAPPSAMASPAGGLARPSPSPPS
jgi:hypothetical protein